MLNLIITGGKGPEREYISHILEKRDFTIAADSGLELCHELGIRPDRVVGDMDSLRDKKLLQEYKDEDIHIYPCDKDDSDTEIALSMMKDRPGELVLIGGGEGRLDHSLALVHLFHRKNAPDRWITAREDIRLIRGKHEIQGKAGRRVSLFALGDTPFICHSRGLQWELNELTLGHGAFSLSNRMKASSVYLDVKQGTGLLMLALDDSGGQ